LSVSESSVAHLQDTRATGVPPHGTTGMTCGRAQIAKLAIARNTIGARSRCFRVA